MLVLLVHLTKPLVVSLLGQRLLPQFLPQLLGLDFQLLELGRYEVVLLRQQLLPLVDLLVDQVGEHLGLHWFLLLVEL